MNKKNIILKAEKEFNIRFSEVDSMNIVWHGAYSMYFEDAREAFGEKYGLKYLYIFEKGFYAPIVELNFQYKSPLTYKDKGLAEIIFRNTDAAKIIFDYNIYNLSTNKLAVNGYSVQVFMDHEFNLEWITPDFFKEWKQINGLL
ncbi:MAG: acyl-CoA thioesterase [Bacteroidales bacterium]|nr:acyl-CoA thioesterase [Bacteroidales bacterium]